MSAINTFVSGVALYVKSSILPNIVNWLKENKDVDVTVDELYTCLDAPTVAVSLPKEEGPVGPRKPTLTRSRSSEAGEKKTCQRRLTGGSNRGQICGKTVHKDTDHCFGCTRTLREQEARKSRASSVTREDKPAAQEDENAQAEAAAAADPVSAEKPKKTVRRARSSTGAAGAADDAEAAAPKPAKAAAAKQIALVGLDDGNFWDPANLFVLEKIGNGKYKAIAKGDADTREPLVTADTEKAKKLGYTVDMGDVDAIAKPTESTNDDDVPIIPAAKKPAAAAASDEDDEDKPKKPVRRAPAKKSAAAAASDDEDKPKKPVRRAPAKKAATVASDDDDAEVADKAPKKAIRRVQHDESEFDN